MSEDNIQVAAKRELAATLLARGWKLLALHDVTTGRCSCLPRADGSECKPGNQGKHPRMGGAWQTQGMSTPEQVNEWLLRAPDMNIGILTGPASGIWALDVDPKNGGDVSLAELERVHGPLPPTWSQTTGSGGRHYLFRLPDDFTPTGSPGRLPPGLDVRGVNGQIVGPGSRTLLGGYKALDNDAPVLDAPGWLLDLIRPAAPDYDRMPERAEGWVAPAPAGTPDAARQHAYAVAAVNAELGKLSVATPGSRGYTAYTVACNLIELLNSPWARLEGGGVWAGFLAAAAQAASYGGGFDEREAVTSWGSAARHVGHQGRPVPPEPTIGGAITLPGPIGGVPPFAGLAPDPVAAGLIPWPREGMAHTPAEQPAPPFDPFAMGPAPFVPTPIGGAHPEVMAAAHKMRVRDAARAVLEAEQRAQAEAGAAARVASLKASMLSAGGLAAMPAPPPLISKLLNLNTTSWLIGKSGSYKSFVALDLAAHVATGRDWQGREVTGGTVLYILGEGAAGMSMRMRAWEARNGPVGDKLMFLPSAVNVKDEPGWAALVALVAELHPSLIIVDTQARMSIGLKENDNAEMMLYVNAVDQLRAASGACVLTVHHIGRSGSDARGASSIDGAQDAELRVERTGSKALRIHQDKQKDATDEETIDIRLEVEGESLVVAAGSPLRFAMSLEQRRAEERDRTGESMLDVAIRVLPEVYATGAGGSKAEIRAAVFERMGRAVPERSSTFDKLWNRLVTERVIGLIRGTSRWMYINVDERLKLVEPTTSGVGFYAPMGPGS